MEPGTSGLSGLVTTAEAGRLLHVSPNAINQRIRRYRIPVVRVGVAILVSLSALRATYAEPPRVLTGD